LSRIINTASTFNLGEHPMNIGHCWQIVKLYYHRNLVNPKNGNEVNTDYVFYGIGENGTAYLDKRKITIYN